MSSRVAVVVGGGIAGLATGLGLARASWDVTVVERQEQLSEVGAGLVLWPNGMRALQVLGLAEQVQDVAELNRVGGYRRPNGLWLGRVDGAALAERHGRLVAVHRADLLQVLERGAREAGVRVQSGTTVAGLGVDGALQTSAGDLSPDLLIGADGIGSVVRTAILPAAAGPRRTGVTAWRWVAGWDEAGLAGDPAASITIGRGMEFGIVPLSGRRVYCYASSIRRADGATPGPQDYGTWHDPIPELVAAGQRSGMLSHDLADLPPLPTFVSDRVALVGDAAHAMTPHLGQGACQGLEDAATLALLAQTHEHVDILLQTYDALRRPRAQAVQRASRQAMRAVTLTSPWLVAARDVATRVMPASLVERGLARWWHPTFPAA